MARVRRTLWHKSRYWLNGFVIVLPVYFLYDSLTPAPPPEAWEMQVIGPFEVTPTPADNALPYQHDGEWVKDFSVQFCAGCVKKIRLAYMSVGEQPAPVPAGAEGILHGNHQMQHVHAPYPLERTEQDRLWISVQEWSGDLHHASWPL